jgi:hypothetical protein
MLVLMLLSLSLVVLVLLLFWAKICSYGSLFVFLRSLLGWNLIIDHLPACAASILFNRGWCCHFDLFCGSSNQVSFGKETRDVRR